MDTKKINGITPIENYTSFFEIGSATKVFTATLLANEISKGTILLDDPVQMHLDVKIKKDSCEQEPLRMKVSGIAYFWLERRTISGIQEVCKLSENL